MYKAILFDLDNTLLPMDEEKFARLYFTALTEKAVQRGYDASLMQNAMLSGIMAMYKNNGEEANYTVFWKTFEEVYGSKVWDDIPYFNEFYKNEFNRAKDGCGLNPDSPLLLAELKPNYRLILATNPMFPAIATETRLSWGNLSKDDFELITSYENCHYSKPNPLYFKEVLEKCALTPEECLMVGNDAEEDMAAQLLGLDVFLCTPGLINRKGKDISKYPKGDFNALREFLKTKQA